MIQMLLFSNFSVKPVLEVDGYCNKPLSYPVQRGSDVHVATQAHLQAVVSLLSGGVL